MLTGFQYIKTNIVNHGLYRAGIVLALALAACNGNESNHAGHTQVTGKQNIDTGTGNHLSHTATDSMKMDNGSRATDTSGSETYWTSLSTNRTVISAQKAIAPAEIKVNFIFNGNGYIAFDWRRNRKVAVRAGGRIEKLYIKYNYQYVRKGEKILELYSPEINTYIEEFLYISRQTSDTILREKAKQKLLLLGLTPGQLRQIIQSGNAPFTIPVYSPYEGYVVFNTPGPAKMDMPDNTNTSGKMGGGMSAGADRPSPAASTALPGNSIREGMYISKDQTLFLVNDYKEVWGIVAFNKENEKYIRKGLEATVISELFPERPFQTSIQFVEPFYQGEQKFSQARVYLPNASRILKQNSLITASVTIPVRALMVPAGSVYYLGKTAIVWIRTGVTKEGKNIFQPRVVRIGHREGNNVEILEGLGPGELIAKDAGYLADSETIIQY